ncbi:RidA family protein [Actinomycetospora cinnamomea]|uniref:Enamine deaminase RidA (YjgF/YER057c/UK114 family) n=1 Tax=Actinomycetospora cinnamomea TaxID=663609 RepID=A0A2U1EA05_9PSEU|nr:RidA family protein [Actinomycetospora cinnamomea]PVY96715.1 enamine deaminase RidA (YjgF/YER057c/UK114 family) [Actinomycetospora cinnamomea]
MPVDRINPSGLPAPGIYRQVAVATGTRTAHLAGQVARTADGSPVGAGDLAAQTEQAYRNVATALAAVGGTFADVAKLTIYVVDLTPEKLEPLVEGAMRAAADLGEVATALTLVGVTALAEPDLLVEVDATAVLP